MRFAVRGALWLVVYLVVVVAPLLLMLAGDPPPARGFWHELSIALGFIGLSMLGLQFATTARFQPVDAPYGLDVVLKFHKEISFVAFAFLLAHPLILVPITPLGSAIYDLSLLTWTGVTGVIALGLLVVIIVTSMWTERFRLTYEWWRLTHGLLGIAVIVVSLVHIRLSGYYVDTAFRFGVWVVLMVVLVGMYAKVRIYQPLRQLRRPWVVESVEPAAQDAWELTLTAQGHDGIRFQPGQFAWVTLGTSPFAIREHPFSFSSSAEHPDRVSFTVKELGDFTTALDRFEPGTRAYLDGPYGVFSYERNEAAGFVFIAGGIGISPIMSMLRTLADRDDRRPMVLLFGAPTWADVALDEELDELSERLDLHVTYVLEDPPEGWEGETGVLSPEVLDRHLPRWRGGTQYFVCGPDAMMDAVESSLLERGVPEDHINLERFDLT